MVFGRIFNLLLTTLNLQVFFVFYYHFFSFNFLTVLNHLHMFSQLFKVVLINNLLQLLFREGELFWILFVFFLQVSKEKLFF
jgi:hypothetical protein